MADIHRTEMLGTQALWIDLNLAETGYCITSVEEDLNYQKIDVDFLLTTPESEIKIEVKSELKYTGNIFLEAIGNNKTKRPGWFRFSEADLLYYYFVDENRCCALRLQEFKQWFKESWKELSGSNLTQYRVLGAANNNGYSAEGWLISINTIKERAPQFITEHILDFVTPKGNLLIA